MLLTYVQSQRVREEYKERNAGIAYDRKSFLNFQEKEEIQPSRSSNSLSRIFRERKEITLNFQETKELRELKLKLLLNTWGA